MNKGNFQDTDILQPFYVQGANDFKSFYLNNAPTKYTQWTQSGFVCVDNSNTPKVFAWPDSMNAIRTSNYQGFCSYMQGAFDYMVAAQIATGDGNCISRLQFYNISISALNQPSGGSNINNPQTTAQVQAANQAVIPTQNTTIPPQSTALNPGTDPFRPGK